MRRFTALIFLAVCLLQAPYALAYSEVGFSDTAKTWDGYANDWQYNGTDTVGSPNLTGGNFIYNGHTLVGIDLSYKTTDSDLTPGDWFFDFDQDNYWDVVLHNGVNLVDQVKTYGFLFWKYTKVVGTEAVGPNDYGLYSTHLYYGKGAMNGYVESFWPENADGRDNHPVMAEVEGDPQQDVDSTPWIYDEDAMPGIMSWSGFGIDLSEFSGDYITYAFAMTCANDVLYGQTRVPTPEPSTFLLLGFGGLGLLLYGRKRNRSL
jgi:hypothetical protein